VEVGQAAVVVAPQPEGPREAERPEEQRLEVQQALRQHRVRPGPVALAPARPVWEELQAMEQSVERRVREV
jgi:hypothetical protein